MAREGVFCAEGGNGDGKDFGVFWDVIGGNNFLGGGGICQLLLFPVKIKLR